MRKARAVLAFIAGLMLLLHAGGAIAYADDRGNNGTVKIHEGDTETEPMRANEPHVCTFHVHGFNFDKSSSGTWSITGQAPGGSGSASGAWSANANGEWRTGVMTLAAGHYKLSVKQTSPATSGGEKQKVFWVDCGRATTGNNGVNNAATPTPAPNQQGNGGGQGNTGNQPASLTGTGSRSKGGTRTGTGSKSKGAGSATGTGSVSGQNATNTQSAASVNGTDNTASVSEHGETPAAGGGTQGNLNIPNTGGNAGAGGNAGMGGNTGAGGNAGTGGNTGAGGNAGTGGNAGAGNEGATGSSGAQGNINFPGAQGNSNLPAGTSATVNTLPSTSTDRSAPLALLGTILVAFGAYLLKRPSRIVH